MPLRSTLLYLSGQPRVRHWAETSPIAKRMSQRFIAGSTLPEALAVCAKLHSRGMGATLDYLGENVKSLADAAQCRDMYVRMLDTEPNVSIKLTQFGLDFSTEACEENAAIVVAGAAARGGFVRIDMESSAYTDRTLAIAARLHQRYGACGTVIQACLRRSAADVTALIAEGVRIRLCKGAYLEPPSVAFTAKTEVDRSWFDLATRLLDRSSGPALATHDEAMIERIERYVSNQGIARESFEFEMLYGIRRDLQKRLAQDGYRLRIYVPFGEAWYPYFMRRLAERPANLFFVLRNLLR